MTRTDPYQTENDADTVIRLEELRGRALVEGDSATLAALLADDLVYTHSNGLVQDKQAFLEHAAGSLRCVSIAWSGLYVQCYGDLAVLSGYMVSRLQPPKPTAPASVEAHVLQVWRRERAAWTMMAFQATRLPAAGLPGHR